MPGPIETAFVEIIATLRFDQKNELTEGIRREVAKAQKEFDKLENVAADTARSITSKLGSLRVEVNVRDALSDVNRLGNAVEAAVADLRALSGRSIDLGTAEVVRDIDNLERSFARLSKEFKSVDGETLSIDVAQAEVRIKEVSVNVKKLLTDLEKASRKNLSIDVAPAVAALRLVGERATTALRQVRAIGEDHVTVKISDLGLDNLEAKLHAVAAEISAVSGKTLKVDARAATAEVGSLEQRTKSFGDTFERVGKRLLAFAVFGGITAGLSQLVSAGVQAAAQIETIEISLDRLFKGFEAAGRQLGGTSREFLANLKAIAIQTPFQFADLGAVSTKLVQLDTNLIKVADATGKIPSRAEVAIGRMRELADAAAGVGATADDINGVVKAISQLAAKGKINLQDLNQIAERLPNFQRQLQIESIIEQLNKVRPELHATVSDFDDLCKNGLIPVNVAVDGLFEGLKKIPGAAGAAAAQARTLTGALSNLKDFATLEFAEAFSAAGATIADNLNAAFTKTDIKTPLSRAIEEVISAAGIATQKALPGVLSFVQKIADEIANGVTAVGDLVDSVARGFGGDLVTGMVTGLTNVVTLLTAVNELLSHLPGAVSEGIGQFVVLSTVLGQISAGKINVLGLVGDQLKIMGVAAIQAVQGLIALTGAEEIAAAGALTLKNALQALATSTVILAVITAAFIAVQQFLGQRAKIAQWSREFQGAVNDATSSLKDFQTTTAAAEDFVHKFADETNKIKIDKLSDFFEGRTSTQLETNLGLSQAKLAELVDTMAQFGNESPQVQQELSRLGINMGVLKDNLGDKEFGNTAVALKGLGDQFRKGAPAAFEAAVAQKTFNFATDDVTAAIVKATRASGDYVGGLKQLQAANNLGAQAEFTTVAAINNVSTARQRALLKDATTTDAAGNVTIDYTKALAGLRAELQDLADTFLDVLEKAPAVGASFQRLTDGVGRSRGKLLDFAKAVDEAGLSASELDAIGQKLGTSLTGEELSKALGKIVTDFKDTLESLKASLPSFSEAVSAAFGKIEIPEGVTGLAAVQAAFDQFSLDKFIVELNKITSAKIDLVKNLNNLADLSTEAVRRLFELKLDPTQLAVAARALSEGGQTVIDAFLAPFQASDALVKTSGTELVNKLVESGIDPALLAAIPGLTDSVSSALNSAISNVELDKLNALKLTVDPRFKAEIAQDIADLKAAQSGASDKATAVPGVDTAAAVESATTAGQQVGAAFTTSLQGALSTDLPQVTTLVAQSLEGLDAIATPRAKIAGLAAGDAFVAGITEGLAASMPNVTAVLDAGPGSLLSLARLAGYTAGAALADAFDLQMERLVNVVGQALTAVLTHVDSLDLVFQQTGDAVAGAFVDGFAEALSEMSTKMVGELDLIKQIAGIFAGDLARLGFVAGLTFSLGFKQGLSVLGPAAEASLNQVLGKLASFTVLFEGLGSQLGYLFTKGLVEGILSNLGAVAAAGASAAGAAEEGARQKSKTRSPSLVFMDVGKDMLYGMVRGFQTATGAVVGAMEQVVSDTVAAAAPEGVGANLAGSLAQVFNVLIDRVNDAFMLLAARLGVQQAFAGAPIKRFAQGLVATQPTIGKFGDRGPEALLPLSDGAAAGRIIAQLAPFLGSQGRAAIANFQGPGAAATAAQGPRTENTWNNHFDVHVPSDDPEAFAQKAMARLERKMSR